MGNGDSGDNVTSADEEAVELKSDHSDLVLMNEPRLPRGLPRTAALELDPANDVDKTDSHIGTPSGST